MVTRRHFLKGLAAGGIIAAAPAIAREGILMPVKQVIVPITEQSCKIGKAYYWNMKLDDVDMVKIEDVWRQKWARDYPERPEEYISKQFAEAVEKYSIDIRSQFRSRAEQQLLRDLTMGATPASYQDHLQHQELLASPQYVMQGWEKQEAVKQWYSEADKIELYKRYPIK